MQRGHFDDDELVAFRHGDWEAVFSEQKKPGGSAVWYEPLTAYRIPKLFTGFNRAARIS